MHRARFLFLFAFVFGAAAVLAGAQNRNAINGRVTDAEGKPLYRIRVELLDEVEMRIAQVYTDGAGLYSFRNLSSGTFILRANADGTHLEQTARISLFATRATGGSHYEQVDLVMPTRAEKKAATSANAGTVFAQEVPEEARKVYERALKQLDNSKLAQQGIASLQEALDIFPKYYLALERLGIEHVKRQEYEPAHAALTRAVAVNPNGSAALYVLGVTCFHLNQVAEAVAALDKSLKLAPNSPNAALTHFYLGLALWKTGQQAQGEPHLKKACELNCAALPADIHLNLARYYSDNKRYKEAADELEMFLKLAPDAADAGNIRAVIRQLRAKATATASSAAKPFAER